MHEKFMVLTVKKWLKLEVITKLKLGYRFVGPPSTYFMLGDFKLHNIFLRLISVYIFIGRL